MADRDNVIDDMANARLDLPPAAFLPYFLQLFAINPRRIRKHHLPDVVCTIPVFYPRYPLPAK
jgi:hypothetical protein